MMWDSGGKSWTNIVSDQTPQKRESIAKARTRFHDALCANDESKEQTNKTVMLTQHIFLISSAPLC